jgi:hypothetical protein
MISVFGLSDQFEKSCGVSRIQSMRESALIAH